MKPGDVVFYKITGKKFWKRGKIAAYPAEGLVTIERVPEGNSMQEESRMEGEFTIGVVDIEMRPEAQQA